MEITQRPFCITGTLEGRTVFYSGYDTKEQAVAALADIDLKAKALKLSTIYAIKESPWELAGQSVEPPLVPVQTSNDQKSPMEVI